MTIVEGGQLTSRRTLASSGILGGAATAFTAIVATTPGWLADLEPDTIVFMELHVAWIYGSSIVASALILGMAIRSTLPKVTNGLPPSTAEPTPPKAGPP